MPHLGIDILNQIENVFYLNVGFEVLSIFITGCLILGSVLEAWRSVTINRFFFAMLLVHLVALILDLVIIISSEKVDYYIITQMRSLLSTLCESTVVILSEFAVMQYIPRNKKKKNGKSKVVPIFSIIIAAIAVLLGLANIFLNKYVHLNFISQGFYLNTVLFGLNQLILSLILIASIIFIIQHYRVLGKWNGRALLGFLVLLLIIIPFLVYWNYISNFFIVTIYLLLFYIVFNVEQEAQLQETRNELMKKRIEIILSQIQPHFLFNSLLVIQDLCHDKAPEAEQAVIEFSEFVRGNLDSLQSDDTIAFTREMGHVQSYVTLEQRRFGDLLQVEYDIQEKDFSVPPLTLEPLAENAIRHGIMKRENGGRLQIRTWRNPDNVAIVIADDGVGFDPAVPKDDGQPHIGVANVRARIEGRCGGRLTINSVPGKGTVAVVIVPAEERPEA